MRLLRLVSVLAWLVMLSACGGHPAPSTSPTAPAFSQYPYPDVSADLLRTAGPAASEHEEAWRAFQTGNVTEASRRFERALKQNAGFYPAETGLGYVGLARRDAAHALGRFDQALRQAPAYTPALIGRGEALLAMGREGDALASYRRALAANPDLADVRRRVEVIEFRAVQGDVATAQEARRAGDWTRAQAAYGRAIEASPESAFLYRDLALVERQLGQADQALAHLERALTLDPNDAPAWLALGELREQREEWQPALDAYRRAGDLDSTLIVEPRIKNVEARVALAALPEAYRAIPGEPVLSRGALAALLGIRLPAVVEAAPKVSVLITDARRHWAQPWILAIAQARLMDVYPNHTFQPGSPVTRGGLAVAVSRVLDVLAARNSQLEATLAGARGEFADLGPGHLLYTAASRAVAAGVMQSGERQAFQPMLPVSGAEGLAALERLEALAGGAGLASASTTPPR